MDKTNNQTELPLDLSSETVENSDPIDLKVATALEPTTETTVDTLPSTSKEHTPVKPSEQENEHTNGRLEEDLPEGPVDLKKRPVAIIKPTVRVVEKIGTLHGESGRSETIEVITIEDSDDEEFNFQTQHITSGGGGGGATSTAGPAPASPYSTPMEAVGATASSPPTTQYAATSDGYSPPDRTRDQEERVLRRPLATSQLDTAGRRRIQVDRVIPSLDQRKPKG